MPRYFFDIDNHKHVNDDDGTNLADDEEARVQAVIFAGDYLSDHPGDRTRRRSVQRSRPERGGQRSAHGHGDDRRNELAERLGLVFRRGPGNRRINVITWVLSARSILG
ncbi:DUF6894 family protein [Sphingomonas sp. H160509]|uniref:DUF6894 family protein n=1 Tax=Sphingomonas sp. H160509 TaxID=2955313 RepID=UPI00406D174C